MMSVRIRSDRSRCSADRRQQDALTPSSLAPGGCRSHGRRGRGRRFARGRPRAAGDEGRDDQHRDGAGDGQPIPLQPPHPPRRLRLGQPRADALPDFEAVLFAAFGRFRRFEQLQCAGQLPVDVRARRALVHVLSIASSPPAPRLSGVARRRNEGSDLLLNSASRFTPNRRERRAQFLHRAEHAVLGGAGIEPERLADFGDRPAFVVAQRERGAFERAEPRSAPTPRTGRFRRCAPGVQARARRPAVVRRWRRGRRRGCSPGGSGGPAAGPPSSWRRCDGARCRNAPATRTAPAAGRPSGSCPGPRPRRRARCRSSGRPAGRRVRLCRSTRARKASLSPCRALARTAAISASIRKD